MLPELVLPFGLPELVLPALPELVLASEALAFDLSALSLATDFVAPPGFACLAGAFCVSVGFFAGSGDSFAVLEDLLLVSWLDPDRVLLVGESFGSVEAVFFAGADLG